MMLSEAVNRHIELYRGMGFKYKVQAYMLPFNRLYLECLRLPLQTLTSVMGQAYFELTYKANRKTVNVKLAPEAAPIYRAASLQYRKTEESALSARKAPTDHPPIPGQTGPVSNSAIDPQKPGLSSYPGF